MDYDNLSKIRAQVSLYTNRKTSNVLDGDFTSVFRGRSLDFDDMPMEITLRILTGGLLPRQVRHL